MKMKHLRSILLLSLTTPVFAEGGFYMGIGGGYSSMTGTTKNNLTFANGATSQSGGAFALTAYAGYDFNRVFGLEANYLGTYANATNSYNATQGLIGAFVLLHLPFEVFTNDLSGFDMFVRGGYDYNSMGLGSQVNCANCINPPSLAYGYTPRFGAGFEYGAGNLGYRLEWNYAGSLNVDNQVGINNNAVLASIVYHY